ncbi:hypothetical protein [Cytobacillus purgationiresistens]|uniref:Uncharacterized protein n=1 Tax=Cytobacillus purgationiresistens TaxID=863449 RepID=A0ABU0AAP5_9BACI|nr:hypothetical protein [Cytobacillus purgationiresistens]MDQ0268314.1 hypothetical protein [Cytobacillus purgationiresistens]
MWRFVRSTPSELKAAFDEPPIIPSASKVENVAFMANYISIYHSMNGKEEWIVSAKDVEMPQKKR